MFFGTKTCKNVSEIYLQETNFYKFSFLCYTEIMQPQTFIFFGPSGSGKGTQARALVETLKEKDPERTVLYLETGQKFREFATQASYTAKKTKEVIESGGLMPEFLPVWIWAQYFVDHISGNEHIILDGISRREHEALIIDSALRFYERKNPVIISIKLSPQVAVQRMEDRGRSDDGEEEIKRRLKWYEDNVVPVLNYFKNNPYYRFIEIDGEHSIEEVHRQIMEKAGL